MYHVPRPAAGTSVGIDGTSGPDGGAPDGTGVGAGVDTTFINRYYHVETRTV